MPSEQETPGYELLWEKSGISEWITIKLKDLEPLTQHSNQTILMSYQNCLDNLSWELQQLQLKKSVEFDSAIRVLTQKLSKLNSEVRGLRLSHRGHPSPIQQVYSSLQIAEDEVNKMTNLLDNEEIKSIKGLQQKKLNLSRLIDFCKKELKYLRLVGEMERAIDEVDFDLAQDRLEELDRIIPSGKGEKRDKIDRLRQRLVEIIQNS